MATLNAEGLVTIQCVPVDQPIGVFYVGAMDSTDLVAISWADVRRIAPQEEQPATVSDDRDSPTNIAEELRKANLAVEEPIEEEPQSAEPLRDETEEEEFIPYEDQGFEQFLGIQRELSPSRAKELKQYVQTVDATFPTAVLLAISSDHASFDKKSSVLSVVRHSKVAKIIDGQHRIAGLGELKEKKFQVNVAIFIDMEIQDQAMVFATINLKQTKVNKSLAYDLYEFTTSRSPQRTCHDIARFLNGRQGSPFKDKVKMLGVAREPTETITQAAFVDRLLRLVSRDPMKDRDDIRRGRRLDQAIGAQERIRIFRNLFIREEDHIIALILWNFFVAVQRKWPTSWKEVERGNILNRTTGFGALMRFMRIAYLSLNLVGQVAKADEYSPIMERINLEDGSFTPDRYLPGSSGERALLDDLLSQSGLEDFR